MPPAASKRSKTSRFPVARIKKIMQMDEEVGKLASATPVMISKSLECFLQLLLDETAKETRERGSRKMVPYHLKAMIDKSDQFDFLRELVEGIPDPREPKTPTTRKRAAPGEGSAPRGRRAAGAAAAAPRAAAAAPPTFGATSSRAGPSSVPTRGAASKVSLAALLNDEPVDPKKEKDKDVPPPNNLPAVGTWVREPIKGEGSGEDGKGMFDDYEDDENYDDF